jgi:hypothetical protein
MSATTYVSAHRTHKTKKTLTEIGLHSCVQHAPNYIRRLALHRNCPFPLAIADLATCNAPTHMAFRAIAAQEVARTYGVLGLRVAMLDHALHGVRATQRIRRVCRQRTAVQQRIRAEDPVPWSRKRVGQKGAALETRKGILRRPKNIRVPPQFRPKTPSR